MNTFYLDKSIKKYLHSCKEFQNNHDIRLLNLHNMITDFQSPYNFYISIDGLAMERDEIDTHLFIGHIYMCQLNFQQSLFYMKIYL